MTYPGTLLRAQKLFARKELGQNFLADPKTAEMIVNRSNISDSDIVLEIGAGLGALTVHAAKKADIIYAVEKDPKLVEILTCELAAANIDNVELINKDILKVDIRELAGKQKFIVLGNLPYNISSQILFALVKERRYVKKAVLMFQKELAQRIQADPGGKDYGRLSVGLQYCSNVKNIASLEGHLFFPRPEVESRVIEISFFGRTCFSGKKEEFFFKVIKAAFSKRRKTLRNSLAGPELGIDPQMAARFLEQSGISPVRRAETLNINEFISLTETLWINLYEDITC